MDLSRRSFVESLAALAAALLAAPAAAQTQAAPANPARFGFEDVLRRARDLAGVPYEANPPPLPDVLTRLDYDSYRDIRFRPDKALLAGAGGPFRMHMFHPGFLFTRPVVVNIIRDGIAAPVPYSASLFDYGRNKFERALPVNLGFAGFRLHAPLNDPKVHDELISFLGASYFRFLGRRQRYGLSARGLAIGVGARETEEFPVFREFWIEQPEAEAGRAVIYALLDGPSVAGAYQFHIYPATETVLDVTMTLFPRRPIPRIGIAPLTSMFFIGENDRRIVEDFRPELHDSDGLMIHTGAGEWLWRPLRNPRETSTSMFLDNNPRGFGLMQRDRAYEHYQDIDLSYELRPSYWVEPR
ncbi:MAG: glucan biosynthesis protein, partial [Alsobacter sp.]